MKLIKTLKTMKALFDLELFLKKGYGIDLDYDASADTFRADVYVDERPSGEMVWIGQGDSDESLADAVSIALDDMRDRQAKGLGPYPVDE